MLGGCSAKWLLRGLSRFVILRSCVNPYSRRVFSAETRVGHDHDNFKKRSPNHGWEIAEADGEARRYWTTANTSEETTALLFSYASGFCPIATGFSFLWTRKGETLVAEGNTPIGYTYQALAENFGMSKSFWRREVRLRRIPFVKFDQAVIILHADLEAYLAERRRAKGGESGTNDANQ